MNENTIIKNITVYQESDHDPVVSDEMLQTFRLVNYVIISGPISALGIIFNIINIIVFAKLGFKDTVNISLLGLAVSDLLSIIPIVWMSVSFNPLYSEKEGSMDLQATQVITGFFHVCFTRVSGCLTAFITLERYLCVALPLKIKTIITPRRTAIIVVNIFVVIVSFIAPENFSFGLHPYFNPETNLTFIGLVYNQNGREIEHTVLTFAAVSQMITIVWVILSTIGLVRTLKQKSKWRNTSTESYESSALSSRDRRTVQMITFISIIFLVSYLPLSISLLGMLVFKEYNIQGKEVNLVFTTATFFLLMESINSSVNIFVYYSMSTKFRLVLLNMIAIRKK